MHPEVVESMRDFFDACYANPTGAHRMARDARRATDDARDILAEALGARPAEIVFCGSGTEADNLAVFGAAAGSGGTVVCSAVEHPAVLRRWSYSAGASWGSTATGCWILTPSPPHSTATCGSCR